MATLTPITLYEGNTETMTATINRVDPADDLSTATGLEMILKDRVCTPDTDTTVVILSSADPTEITITTQTAATIIATIVVPTAATNPPYDRVWRLDVLFGAARRTAMYGPADVVDL